MPKNNGVTYMTDMSAVATTMAAIESAAQVADTDRYIGKLINAAHAKMVDEFNSHIVADAMASSAFHHVFEWGTAGINTGKTTRRLNPMSQEAQLWENTMTGSGKNKSMGFKFLPSKVPVPLPTTTKTGISQKYLSRLKGKNIFWNKAAVMEAGTPVSISPKNGGKLFIPLAGWSGADLSGADKARGFIMTTKTVTVVPGGQNIGTFTAYWERFWEGLGQKGMETSMYTDLEKHLERVRQTAQMTRGTMAPASSGQVQKAAARGRKMGADLMVQQAEATQRKRGRE